MLDMDILVGQGRGYVPADKNKSMSLPIGYIAIDSMYTPVKRASYVVETLVLDKTQTMINSLWKLLQTEQFLQKKLLVCLQNL